MKHDLKKVKTDFVKLARMQQADLKKYLSDMLLRAGYTVYDDDGYTYARGSDVLLTAHLDTVHKKPVKKVYTATSKKDIVIESPQGIGGDDRCGVWIIQYVLPQLIARGIRPTVLFCEDEEIGGIGSEKFCETQFINELTELKYLIELDRKGRNDAVFYNDDNTAFQEYILRTTRYELEYGSFSDISHLCPACGRSGVNLSCGYYNPHQLTEYVSAREMARTADTVVNLITDTVTNNVPQFDYTEKVRAFSQFGEWYEDAGAFSRFDDGLYGVEFHYMSDGKHARSFYESPALYEAIGEFMVDHPALTWADVLDYELI